jgi:peptidoglycan lytic transglycosylase B
MRFSALALGLVLLLQQQQIPPVAQVPPQSFDEWLSGVRAEALTLGVRAETLDKALTGLEPLDVVIQRDRSQAEIVQTLDHYLNKRLTKKLVETAQTQRKEHASLLKQVSDKYGVPGSIIVAIWGIESNFGRFSGVRPTIATLATLAYDPRRSTMFRRELFDALKILDSGDVEPSAMQGSWAGALGQPQFMPSSFLLYAQDFDGDGRRDIWQSQPDVFASIANYLSAHGWKPDQTWGREVTVPRSVLDTMPEKAPLQTEGCLARRQMTAPLPLSTWKKLGVRTATRGALPVAPIDASLIAGDKRHFLVYPNYQAILEYNCVNAYALTVGLLADRATHDPPPAKRSARHTKK